VQPLLVEAISAQNWPNYTVSRKTSHLWLAIILTYMIWLG